MKLHLRFMTFVVPLWFRPPEPDGVKSKPDDNVESIYFLYSLLILHLFHFFSILMKTFNLKLEIINDFVFKSTKTTVEYI